MRAMDLLFQQSMAFKRLGIKLTSPAEHAPVEKAVDQLLADFAALRKTCTENEKIIAKALASEVLQKGAKKQSSPSITVYTMDMSDRDVGLVKSVAKTVVTNNNNSLLVLLSKPPASNATNFVIAASPELTVDLRPMLKEIFAVFPGKGGGDQKFVQGSFNSTDVTALLEHVNVKLHAL